VPAWAAGEFAAVLTQTPAATGTYVPAIDSGAQVSMAVAGSSAALTSQGKEAILA